jgi:hypothetical protein
MIDIYETYLCPYNLLNKDGYLGDISLFLYPSK